MRKIPQVKPKEVTKALQRLGFGWGRTDGSHARLIHKSILRQAEITVEELINNL